MDKKKFPREGAAPNDDGLPLEDTEGHRSVQPGTGGDYHKGPGTGGDLSPRRPTSGGELIDENDVEGHGLPGTGGDDFSPRRPSSGGDLVDDTQAEGR